jgi:hypothetical protein
MPDQGDYYVKQIHRINKIKRLEISSAFLLTFALILVPPCVD